MCGGVPLATNLRGHSFILNPIVDIANIGVIISIRAIASRIEGVD